MFRRVVVGGSHVFRHYKGRHCYKKRITIKNLLHLRYHAEELQLASAIMLYWLIPAEHHHPNVISNQLNVKHIPLNSQFHEVGQSASSARPQAGQHHRSSLSLPIEGKERGRVKVSSVTASRPSPTHLGYAGNADTWVVTSAKGYLLSLTHTLALLVEKKRARSGIQKVRFITDKETVRKEEWVQNHGLCVLKCVFCRK
ncbi:hypothetical protein AVEN_36239-1 [Araneus ventricosus]|uniref:Uncharacterized protein n=1 Tax=Araneus ventricosus TaxID=182803 RepID=A0A4Y2J8A4_ARAVE|nr:hypothetical protein AVEN_36239-1 [Araneus ventricosus]